MRTVPITTAASPFEDIAAEVAKSPHLIKALRAEHRDDGTGHCRSCTTPGTGTREVPVPCSLRTLADFAAQLCSLRTLAELAAQLRARAYPPTEAEIRHAVTDFATWRRGPRR